MEFNHKPVLLKECIEGLKINPDGIYVDGTLGGAGHSKEILKILSTKGRLIGIDRDKDALKVAKSRLQNFENVTYVYGNHDDIKELLESLQIDKVDGILLDLGVSSYQIDTKSRGFSYMLNSELDMRMDLGQSLTAKEIVNTYKEEELARIIYEYGEEKFSKAIARKIVESRNKKEIETTGELVEIIKNAVPYYDKSAGHPAKRTFQAIRIETNNEIEPLYNTVINAIKCLKPGGRLCVITFHSLEDKIVKKIFKEVSTIPNELKGLPIIPEELEVKFKMFGTVEPTETELLENNRARSAKLRIVERIKR